MVVDVKTGAVFSMMTLALEVATSPEESCAVATHVIVSPTLVSFARMVYVLPVAREEVPTNHSYVGLRVPSSGSLAEELHERSVPVYTPVLGEMDASVSNVGPVLIICVLVLVDVIPPSASVALMVQDRISSMAMVTEANSRDTEVAEVVVLV